MTFVMYTVCQGISLQSSVSVRQLFLAFQDHEEQEPFKTMKNKSMVDCLVNWMLTQESVAQAKTSGSSSRLTS
jgi:hypothetical protein